MAPDLDNRPDPGSDSLNPGQKLIDRETSRTGGGASLIGSSGSHTETKPGLANAEAAAGGLFHASGDNSSVASGVGGSLANGLQAAGIAQFAMRGLKGKVLGSQNRKKQGIFGSIIGLLIGGGFFGFTVLSGPAEFIQFAKLMEEIHLSSQQNEQDDRFTKEARFFRYATKGEVENTRMGFLGNRLANTFESKLNESGLQSSYTDKFGLFDGYQVTEEKPANLSDDDFKQQIAEKWGVDPDSIIKGSAIKGSALAVKDSFVIDASSISFADSYRLNYGLLKAAGYSKLSSAIGARLFCTRAGCDWHPLSSKKSNLKRSVEDKTQPQEDQENAEDIQAQEAISETPTVVDDMGPNPDSSDQDKAIDTANKDEVDASVSDLSAEGAAAAKDPSKIAGLSSSIKDALSPKTLAGGGLAGVGVICLLNGFNNNYYKIKQTEIVAPLIRMSSTVLALGSQIESGDDVDLGTMGALSKQLHGTDSTGAMSSWSASPSIMTDLGENTSSTVTDRSLTSINSGSPFADISKLPLVSTVCGGVGQYAQGFLSFALAATGVGLLENAVKGLVQGAVIGELSSTLANFLAGKPVNTAAVGKDYGNDVDYGTALYANADAISSGGVKLSTVQANAQQTYENIVALEQFKNQDLGHRLFSPTDPHSAVASFMQNISPDIGQDLSLFGTKIFNFGSMLSSIPKLFSVNAHATGIASVYNYGFPTYGFSEQDMDNPAVENPYANADSAVELFKDNATDSSGTSYVQKASSCFGVNIAPDSAGNWDVTNDSSTTNADPYGVGYSNNNCAITAPPDCTNDNSDGCNWLRVRMFIMDTETMNSMGCYSGDSDVSNEACSDIGFSDETAAATIPTAVDTTTLDQDSSNVPCAAGTNDIGTNIGYANGAPVNIKLCEIPNLPSSGSESTSGNQYYITGADGHAIVNSRVSGEVFAMVQAADAAGVDLTADSSYRSMAHQTCLFNHTCGSSEAAQPGYSNHQMGLAIDFTMNECDQNINGQCSDPSNPFWEWLSKNAATYGYRSGVPLEAWHWSPTGN